ncbi:MAG: trk/ktr system potassium uptake protein [Pseudonocardiales bacterium]|jgi:trk system potassium uptake protein TrkA|nr:trk/ktr system potassium uptake protein [Pseudonocardiales bacterium]
MCAAVHIVIMGCGRVGAALALQLAPLDHTLSIIDQEPLAFRRLGDHFPGNQVKGVGFDRDTLIEAGIEQAGAFAAVSSGDNSNIIAARVARETFGVQRVVARIYDPKRAEVYERLGIPTVATVPWTSSRLLKAVLGETTAEAWRDPSGAVALVAVAPHEGWIGRSIADFEAATGTRAAIYTRFGTGQLPLPSTLIQSGDTLHMLTIDEHRTTLHEVAGRAPDGSAA